MRPQKITFGDMRDMGVRGIFVHSVRGPWAQIAKAWPHTRTKQMMFAPAAAGAGWIGKVANHASCQATSAWGKLRPPTLG
jgi:hypothetical protein